MSAYLSVLECVRVYVYLCMCVYICTHVCTGICGYMCMLSRNTYMCISVYIFCVHICLYIYTCMFICVAIHVSILPNFCSSLYLSALISLINLFLLKLPPAAPAQQTHKQKKALFNTFQWQSWGLQTLTIVTMTGQAYVTCQEWVSESSPPEANSEVGVGGWGGWVIPSGKSDWFIKDAGWGKAKPGSQTAG